MIVVSDTSVLCYLALLGRLSLLADLFGEVIVPPEVLSECLHAGAPEALRQAFEGQMPPNIRVVTCDQLLPETASLDTGEAATISIAWACRDESLVLIDERSGRSVAEALGLRVRCLLGLLAEGHRRGFLDFDQAVERLKSYQFRVSSALLQTFRRALGL